MSENSFVQTLFLREDSNLLYVDMLSFLPLSNIICLTKIYNFKTSISTSQLKVITWNNVSTDGLV